MFPMSKILLFFLLFYSFCFSQKEVEIETVVVKRAPKIENILKKLQKQLVKNCDTTTQSFLLRQVNLQNSDTIIFRNEEQVIKINALDGKFIKKNRIENKDNWFTKVKETFKLYDATESPIGWISGFPIRKNLTVTKFDFLVNSKNYVYEVAWTAANTIEVTFETPGFYKGSFIIDKNYNLLHLEYETITPYPFYYTSAESVGKYHKFTSSWIYQREKVHIDFTVVNKKMILTALSIEEKLRDFLFNRYNKEGLIFTDRTNFTTSIELQNIRTH